jgi:hypothetical protein
MQHFSPEIWKAEVAWWDDNIKMLFKVTHNSWIMFYTNITDENILSQYTEVPLCVTVTTILFLTDF